MSAVKTINGFAVSIGFAGTAGGLTITTPALTAMIILQSADFSQGATNYRVENEVGDRCVSAWSDPHQKATLELYVKGATASLAAAITATSTVDAISPGDLIIIGACQQLPELASTSYWEVMDSPKLSGTNKDAKKWTCNIEKSAGITAQVGA